MRIGVDASELRPGAIGGVPTAIRLLLSALKAHGRDVEPIALAPRPIDAPEGIPVRVTGGPARPRSWRRSRALRRATADLDLFHSTVTAFPDLPRIPVTATVHELPFVVDYHYEGQRRALAQWYWLSRALGRCVALVAPSRVTLRQMEEAHPAAGRITAVVPHPAPPAPDHEQHGHDGSVLFVGRLDRRKCVDALVRGAAAGKGEIRLVGAHATRRRAEIERIAAACGVRDRIRFHGVVDAKTLDSLYGRAQVVVVPSASEGFGFPVLEALARSVPVIVTRDTGAAEVAGEAGLLVDPGKADQITAAVERAAEAEWRGRIARLGPARSMEFSAERAARGYAEVFRRALAR
jgi:glycosyltransferase involved in cell wall biosynthesis